MMIVNLQKELESQFDLVCFEDLGDVCVRHRDIFDLFKRVRQDSFQPDHRLVLYSSHMPEQRILNHIQRAASRIDISNFFILVITPFDLSAQLYDANRQFGYDDTVIGSMTMPLAGTRPLNSVGFMDYSSICPLPFAQLDINSLGHAAPCCKFQGRIGNTKDLHAFDVFNNDAFKQIRQQMLAGIKPNQCATCWHNESNGTASYRKYAIDKFGDQLDQEWLDDIKIRDLTISPLTLCNFKCRICRESLSSSIAVETIKFSTNHSEKEKLRQMIKNDNDPVQSQTLIESISHMAELEFLHVLGGEPLLWPQLEDLIDTLIITGQAENLSIELNTNGSIYPRSLIDKIIDNFKCLELLISIDDVGQRFEISRGGVWSDVHQNLRRFADLRSDNMLLKLAVTVNIQNVLYLEELIQLEKALPIDGILWWYLENPPFMCIDYMPDSVKNAVYQKYNSHDHPELRAIAQRMLSTKPNLINGFYTHMETLDQRRDQNWRTSHSELADILCAG